MIIARHQTPTCWVVYDFSHICNLWILWRGLWLLHALVFHMPKPEFLTEKLPESIESSRFVSHRERMSGEFDEGKIRNQQISNEGLEYS